MKLRGKATTPKATRKSICPRCPYPIEKGQLVVLMRSGWVHLRCTAAKP